MEFEASSFEASKLLQRVPAFKIWLYLVVSLGCLFYQAAKLLRRNTCTYSCFHGKRYMLIFAVHGDCLVTVVMKVFLQIKKFGKSSIFLQRRPFSDMPQFLSNSESCY